MKVCKTCGVEKSEEEFAPRNANGQLFRPDGSRHRRPHCRACFTPKRSPEAKVGQARRYYERHGETVRSRQREYNQTEAGRTSARRGNLRSRYGIEDVGHTEREWLRLLARHGGKCFYCRQPATERDHILPLSRGGTDFIGNIIPACRDCNNSKDKKLLIEFLNRKR